MCYDKEKGENNMNIIKNKSTVSSQQSYTISDLYGQNFETFATAFIGKCGNGPENSLYLITYDNIFLANDPRQSWSGRSCTVKVDTFVDVEITIKE